LTLFTDPYVIANLYALIFSIQCNEKRKKNLFGNISYWLWAVMLQKPL